MKQKVWYVFDDTQRRKALEKCETEEPGAVAGPEGQHFSPSASKNPALAFSCSMLVWGSGQMYGRAYRPGALFTAAMLLFYAPLAALLFFRAAASRWVSESSIPASLLLTGAMLYLLIGLFGWLANAADAFYRIRRARSEPYRGGDSLHGPLCGSLLFPGWGQFLNGQPGKGLFFLCWGGVGILAGALVAFFPHVWPLFEVGTAAYVLEVCLVVALLLLVLAFLLWIVAIYDALSSSKKLLTVKYRGSRVRDTRLVKVLIPRWNAILGLALAISLGTQWMPREYYLTALEQVRIETRSRHMELVPELLGRVIEMTQR